MAAIELIPLTTVNLDIVRGAVFRVDDENECALAGNTAAEAAFNSALHADASYSVYCGGELVGFAGYKYDGVLGPCDLWLLTTPAVERHKIAFVRFAHAACARLRPCHQLRIVVAIEYVRALRLAESLGFRFRPLTDNFVLGETD